MDDCSPKGPLPTWSLPFLAKFFRSSLPFHDLEKIISGIADPPIEWLMTDAGTKSRRRRKATRNIDVRKRGDVCRRCGEKNRIEIHHVVPLYISEERGPWREVERETVDLCVACHNLFEEAIERVMPVTTLCHKWAAHQFILHPEWPALGDRGQIESRVVRWALSHVAREPELAKVYELAIELFLKLELPVTDRRVLSWQLRRRLKDSCQRCGAETGLLQIISLPFTYVAEAIQLGFDPLDPAVGATLCHPCARAYVHKATKLGSPETDLAEAIALRTNLLHE